MKFTAFCELIRPWVESGAKVAIILETCYAGMAWVHLQDLGWHNIALFCGSEAHITALGHGTSTFTRWIHRVLYSTRGPKDISVFPGIAIKRMTGYSDELGPLYDDDYKPVAFNNIEGQMPIGVIKAAKPIAFESYLTYKFGAKNSAQDQFDRQNAFLEQDNKEWFSKYDYKQRKAQYRAMTKQLALNYETAVQETHQRVTEAMSRRMKTIPTLRLFRQAFGLLVKKLHFVDMKLPAGTSAEWRKPLEKQYRTFLKTPEGRALSKVKFVAGKSYKFVNP